VLEGAAVPLEGALSLILASRLVVFLSEGVVPYLLPDGKVLPVSALLPPLLSEVLVPVFAPSRPLVPTSTLLLLPEVYLSLALF
jgi:hypothetical protein